MQRLEILGAAVGEVGDDEADEAPGDRGLAECGVRCAGTSPDVAKELGEGVHQPPVGAPVSLADRRVEEAELGETGAGDERAEQRGEDVRESHRRRPGYGAARQNRDEKSVEGRFTGEVEAGVEIVEVRVEGARREAGGDDYVGLAQRRRMVVLQRDEQAGDDLPTLAGSGGLVGTHDSPSTLGSTKARGQPLVQPPR